MNLCLGKELHFLRRLDILFLALSPFYKVVTPRKRQHVEPSITNRFEGMHNLDSSEEQRGPGEAPASEEQAPTRRPETSDSGTTTDTRLQPSYITKSYLCYQGICGF